LLCQNPGRTAYSLGGVGSEFAFTDNTLSVKDDEQVKTYHISFEKTALTRKEFIEQLKNTDKIPDIASFDNFIQYNLCESNSDTPGYRLYVVDDQYWMGTLYKNTIWRVVSLDIELWHDFNTDFHHIIFTKITRYSVLWIISVIQILQKKARYR